MAVNIHDRYVTNTPTVWDMLYFPSIIRSILFTLKRLFLPKKNVLGVEKHERETEKTGRPFLLRNSEGLLLCNACHLCEKVCPSKAIYIRSDNVSENQREEYLSSSRYPNRFEINLLMCLSCALCVCVCPNGAIELDIDAGDISASKESFFLKKERVVKKKS